MVNTTAYRFHIDDAIGLDKAESTLPLAILAAEGPFGESKVRMDVSCHVDAPRRVILIDGKTDTGRDLVRVFTSLITRDFGANAFSVRRVPSAATEEVAA